MKNMVARFKKEGVPIDGLGEQFDAYAGFLEGLK